jgi:hypothetical protein
VTDDESDEIDGLRRVAESARMPGTVSPESLGIQLESSSEFIARMRATQAGPAVRRSRGLRVAVAFSVIVVIGALAVASPWRSSPAAAATPPALRFEFANEVNAAYAPGKAARGDLLRLAAAARTASPNQGSGMYQLVRTSSWDAHLDPDSANSKAIVVATERSTWLAPDGSMHIEESKGDIVNASGQLAARDPIGTTREELSKGTFDASRSSNLGSNTTAVKQSLLSRADCLNKSSLQTSTCLYREVADLYSTYVVSPELAAYLWTVLAGQPEFRSLGSVTDRLGRTGVGISIDNNKDLGNQRPILIISTTSGQLLGQEILLTRNDPELNLKAPVVYSFSSIVSARYTASDK